MKPNCIWFRGLPEDGAHVERLDLAIPNLPEELSGVTILFASDIHAGFTFPEAAQDRLIEQMKHLAPDMILWGGDFAETKRDARQLFGKIARLKPRLGMAGVPGNNDRRAFRGAMEELNRLAEGAGMRFLINGRWSISANGGKLTILGLDEDYFGAPDASILDGVREEGETRILLSHSPALLEKLFIGHAPPPLILTGHTHGGQMRLGSLTPYSLGFEGVRPRQRFFTVRGVRRGEGWTLLVSGGLGSSRLPLRIGCAPEMQWITLSRR